MTSKNHLSRRSALKSILTGVSGAGLATGLAAPAIANTPPIEWRMVTSWPKNLPGPGVTARRLVERINEMSGGRLVITLYAAGELVPALEVFGAVENGTAEMAHTASLFWSGKFSPAPIFTAGPFGLTPLEHIAWINNGGGQALWDELYEPSGIKPLMAGNTGFQMGGWFVKPVESLEDFKGLKIRMPGLGGAVVRKLGAVPVTLAPGDIYTNLQSGVIDATEFLGPYSDRAMGFYKAAKYYYSPGFHEPNGTGEALVSIEAFEALPLDLQAIVRAACAEENAFSLGEAEWLNAESLNALVAENGVELRVYPDDVINAARNATVEVMQELAAKDALSGRIVESYRQAARHLDPWSDVSVKAFLSARS